MTWAGDPLVALVEEVHALPYGRPADRTPAGMLREGRGTCSTKHLHLARELAERWPDTRPALVHRVYTLTPAGALAMFGPAVAAAVPPEGLTDVHRYLTIERGGRRLAIDVTFPGPRWDGRTSMPLSCGPGRDHPAAGDPDEEKRALEARHCDPAVREPFIAALAGRTVGS